MVLKLERRNPLLSVVFLLVVRSVPITQKIAQKLGVVSKYDLSVGNNGGLVVVRF